MTEVFQVNAAKSATVGYTTVIALDPFLLTKPLLTLMLF